MLDLLVQHHSQEENKQWWHKLEFQNEHWDKESLYIKNANKIKQSQKKNLIFT